MNEYGFGYPPTSNGTRLFVFDGRLYAHNEYGLFQMVSLVCREWKTVFTPAPAGDYWVEPLGNYLFLGKKNFNKLWRIKEGEDFTSTNWIQITSKGLPGGACPRFKIIFNKQIYGVYNFYDSASDDWLFEIWRSADIDKTTMNWNKVVGNNFGDPKNNQGVNIMAIYNSHVYAGTLTRTGWFGNYLQFGDGVEIWESPSGDPGTWTQVNIDGFGTEIKQIGTGITFRTNQDIYSWAVYKAPNQTQEYLYIGTSSHYGAEIWRYDGTGKNGWKNVTPPWAGVYPYVATPGRNLSMIVFQNNLYLAEGFPTANLGKYDGKNWSIVVSGPNPFGPNNQALTSLAIFEDRFYVATRSHYSAVTKGDQVYGYPLLVWKYACTELYLLNRRLLFNPFNHKFILVT
ncbi:MAG: hypothetical protein HXS48_03710 [Theionarchaea archaeon]|nr:hypothetical protein [Theionarchaea archaeon]